jgi:hypothetical protein
MSERAVGFTSAWRSSLSTVMWTRSLDRHHIAGKLGCFTYEQIFISLEIKLSREIFQSSSSKFQFSIQIVIYLFQVIQCGPRQISLDVSFSVQLSWICSCTFNFDEN